MDYRDAVIRAQNIMKVASEGVGLFASDIADALMFAYQTGYADRIENRHLLTREEIEAFEADKRILDYLDSLATERVEVATVNRNGIHFTLKDGAGSETFRAIVAARMSEASEDVRRDTTTTGLTSRGQVAVCATELAEYRADHRRMNYIRNYSREDVGGIHTPCGNASVIGTIDKRIDAAIKQEADRTAPDAGPPETCRAWLWNHDQPYPKSCPTCGFGGPCKFGIEHKKTEVPSL